MQMNSSHEEARGTKETSSSSPNDKNGIRRFEEEIYHLNLYLNRDYRARFDGSRSLCGSYANYTMRVTRVNLFQACALV